MPALPIAYFPSDVLRSQTKPVKILNNKIDSNIKKILRDMCETMYENNGIGLAANQINCPYSLVTIDVSARQKDAKLVRMINPEIVWKSDVEIIYQEGCLSLPGTVADVRRAAEVEVKYLDESAQERSLKARDVFSVCLQHEIDHLKGILYIDYLSRVKRDIIIRKVAKFLKQRDRQ